MKAPLTPTLILLNVVGALSYLALASRTWLEPELAGVEVARGGDAFVWFLSAMPILAVFVAINFSVVLFHLFSYLRKRKWRLGAAALSVPILWAIVVYIDFSHH
jgi:hypothetical protein